MTGPLVSTEALAARLGAGTASVVDATWFMPGDPRTGAEEYRKAHIPGAVFFDIDAIADRATTLPHMLPTPEAFAEAAGRLGLSRERFIAVYDAQGIFSAPRVWWTLRVMGFEQVAVLDGGLRKWLAEGRPVEAGEARPAPTVVTPMFDADLVRDIAAVRAAAGDGGDAQIVDARPGARFRGEAPEPRPGLKSGHMPGACSLPYADVVAADGTLRPPAELAQAVAAAGIDLARPVITTCGSGVSAAVLALALARLGCERTAVYDGSWAEWGGREDTPVAVG